MKRNEKKMTARRLALTLAALLLLLAMLFCGCGEEKTPDPDVPNEGDNEGDPTEEPGGEETDEKTEKLTVNGTDISEFVIGFNKNAVSGGETAKDYFNEKLTSLCDVTLKTSTAIKDRYEIQIGLDTGNKEIADAYAAAKAEGALLGVSGKKIFFLGKNYAELKAAIDAFFAKATGDATAKEITVSANETVKVTKVELKFLTYNVQQDLKKAGRADTAMQDMIDIIRAESPDVWGAQECTGAIGDAFINGLPEYCRFEGTVYHASSRMGDYVFWKADKFNLLGKGHWFMSGTPNTSSKFPGSNEYRGFTYIKLEEKSTGNRFYFINVHTDYNCEDSVRTQQLKVLSLFLKRLEADARVVILGDFNTTPTNNTIVSFLEDNPRIVNSLTAAEVKGDTGSTLAVTEFSKRSSYIFDYVFASADWTYVKYYTAVPTMASGKYPSDHLPVVATIDVY